MKTVYLCGPTLYDDIHIGNARSLVFFDVLSEYFRRNGGVKYTRNITDVDQKIVDRCGKVSPWIWVNETTLPQYRLDCDTLGLSPPDHEPRASDYFLKVKDVADKIGERQEDGSVLLDTSKVGGYGEVSGRITNSKFALWKNHQWTSMGWHSECQAMIHSIYGDKGVDIHGGGSDLKFPHHENENAIHKCLTGNPIAREWVHVGTVNMGSEKMSKSLGNIQTVKDLSNDWSTITLRTALLMTKYSKPINWTHERLLEAEKVGTPQTAWLTDAEWDDKVFENNYTTRIGN